MGLKFPFCPCLSSPNYYNGNTLRLDLEKVLFFLTVLYWYGSQGRPNSQRLVQKKCQQGQEEGDLDAMEQRRERILQSQSWPGLREGHSR